MTDPDAGDVSEEVAGSDHNGRDHRRRDHKKGLAFQVSFLYRQS
jgi:hypothetical protein